jgi:rhodanese-related sulfurtransferase
MTLRDHLRGAPSVGAAEAMRLVDAGALVVDVRSVRLWTRAHIPGSVPVPLQELEGRAPELPDDRLLVTVCTGGLLSRGASGLLARLGFDVVNLSGGLMEWRAANGPLEGERVG